MLALALLSFAAAASALAVQPSEMKVPLPLGDITWTAPSEHGNVSFTGSHADVIAQIGNLHPRWQSNETYLHELINSTHVALSAETGLQKRSNRVSQYCSQWGTGFWQTNGVTTQVDNLNYILQHYGTGMCTVGARTCGRFSCSYNAALLLCNDNPFMISVPCQTLATNLMFIISTCMQNQLVGGSTWYVEGQAFYINPTYNVMVKHTDDGKAC